MPALKDQPRDAEPVRLALIGFGYWGPNYARMLNELPGAVLRIVCDSSADCFEHVLKYGVPVRAWDSRAFVALTFQFPDAVSPQAMGVSNDTRIIGCGFIRVTFRPGDPSQ